MLLISCATLVNRYITSTHPWLILTAGLVPLLCFPLAISVGLAALSKSSTLRIATAVVVAAYLFVVAPVDAVVGCQSTSHDEEITIVASNILANHGADVDAIADLAETTKPDVLVISESTNWILNSLEPELEDAFPFQSRRLTNDHNGTTVFSRWPLTNIRLDPIEVPSTVVTVESPYGMFELYAVHTQAPVKPFLGEVWARHLTGLQKVQTTRPTILAGDFNATEDHKLFRELLGKGWQDVHDSKGCGPDNTFPSSRPQATVDLSIPLLRLDHVLVTEHFETLSVEPVKLIGSDHAAVRTTIRLTTP